MTAETGPADYASTSLLFTELYVSLQLLLSGNGQSLLWSLSLSAASEQIWHDTKTGLTVGD